MSRHIRRLKMIALQALFITLGIQGARAADEASLQAAKKEGRVVFYSSIPSGVLEKLVEDFSKRNPGISAEYYRSTSTGILTRLDAEINTRRLQADVVYMADNAEMDILKKNGRLQPYVSPEYANYPAQAIDADHAFFVSRAFLLVIGYNTAALSVDKAPKTWLDLQDKSLSGRIGISDPRNSGGGTYWRHAMWKWHGASYMQGVAANKPVMQTGFANLNDKIVSGELAAGLTGSYLVDEAVIERKAPIRAVYPSDGVPVVPGLMGIVKGAPHPQAAKVFIDYCASVEGQRILNSRYTYSMRSDVPPLPGMRPFKDVKAQMFTPEDLAENQVSVQRASREPFGLK